MPYKLGAVKPHVAAAAEEIGRQFGIKNVGGYRRFGSVPNSDHPKGLALDFMTFSKTTHDAIATYAIANASRLGVTYVITFGKIWTATTGEWKTYTGPSPHIDHVHVSFSESGGGGGPSVVPVGGGGLWNNLPIIGELEHASERLQDPKFWQRVGMYGLGTGLVIVGAVFLLRSPVESAVTDVIKVVK